MARITTVLASGAVALATAATVAAPVAAHPAHHPRGDSGGLSLTRGAAATLDRYDVDVRWDRDRDRDRRTSGYGYRGRGAVTFDGATTERWTRIRVNERTNRVTAVVDGGDRRAVLRFRGNLGWGKHHHSGWDRGDDRRGRDRVTVLRLTRAGAASIDRAAGADAFDAGDPFAKAVQRHHHKHR